MADKKQYSKIGKSYSVISDITVAPIKLASQNISNWVDAINAARDIRIPRRRKLIELQDNIKLDGKVKTAMSKALANVLNKEFGCYSKSDKGAKVDRVQSEIIEAPFFDKLLEYLSIEEDGYGHVAMEIVPGDKGIADILMIPHANVVPETGLILPNYMDTQNGILFRGPDADPFCKKFILEFGGTKNYGLLMEIAQYVIYKRGGFGDWAQFAELFGMPFRVGKYNPVDPNSRKLLNEALRLSGGAGYATIPEGTSLEFIQSNYGSGQAGIFKDLIQACNDEIIQMWLGGNMTTEDGASKSQGEVHERGENAITAAKLKKILKFLNGPFKERLPIFGYPEAANSVFKIESPDLIPLKDRITIDTGLNSIIEIDPKYFYDKYQVPAPESGPAAKVQTTPALEPPTQGNEPQKKKTKPSLKLNAYYSDHRCQNCAPGLINSTGIKLSFEDDINRLAMLIYNGKISPGTLDKTLLEKTALKLMEGVRSGYLRSEKNFTEVDKILIEQIRENVWIFSGFKTEKMLQQATDLLIDDNGKLREYGDFKSKMLELNATYNQTYLNVEYNFTVARAQMASKVIGWQELGADFPNRKYITAGDDRVRPVHAILNGLILPGNDPRVDEIMPVKDFGCRCDMDATDEEVNDSKFIIDPSKLGPYKGNIVKDGVMFPSNHPYYETSKAVAKKVTQTAKSLM